ncbi:HAD-IB family hydrolase [Candidatus Woesearchaeota archaeon]|nr:HAD-IB family hydrolase [Candidatus Woesearchaeota archaeon]
MISSFSMKNTVKDNIISILLHEFPLSVRDIHAIIKEKHSKNVTYQAVHKTVKQLYKDQILLEKDRKFFINQKWILNIKNLIKNFDNESFKHSAIQSKGIKNLKQEGDVQNITFESLGDAEKYRKELQLQYISRKKHKSPYCSQSQHLKSPIVYSERSIKVLDEVKKYKTRCFLLVRGNSVIDEWCANYYRNDFVKIKTGVRCAELCELYVMGDLILQLYIPKILKKTFEEYYNNVKDISELNVPSFHKAIYERKTKVRMLVYKNTEIAEQIRKQTLSYFEKVQRAAFFDMDGTLVRGILIPDFAYFLHKRGMIKKEYLNSINSLIKNYKSNKLKYNTMTTNLLNTYALSIKGKKVFDIKKLADEFVAKQGKNLLYDYSISLVRKMNSIGKTIMITGSPRHLAEAINKILNMDMILTSELAVKEKKYTGKIIKNLSLENKKLVALKYIINSRTFDLKNSFAFGDTMHDLPLLKNVGNPITLNPTSDLLFYAKKRKWSFYYDNSVLKEIDRIIR